MIAENMIYGIDYSSTSTMTCVAIHCGGSVYIVTSSDATSATVSDSTLTIEQSTESYEVALRDDIARIDVDAFKSVDDADRLIAEEIALQLLEIPIAHAVVESESVNRPRNAGED